MGQRRTRLAVITGIGFVLIFAGLAAAYWPAAFVFAGVAMATFGLTSDDGEDQP